MLTKIRRKRLERDLPQWQLAQQAGIRAPRLSEIERGRARPTSDELARLAQVLGVAVRDIEERGRASGSRRATTRRRRAPVEQRISARGHERLRTAPNGRPS